MLKFAAGYSIINMYATGFFPGLQNGQGEDDSWKSQLEDEGYDVRVIMKGLGEFEGIRRIFLDHIEETME